VERSQKKRTEIRMMLAKIKEESGCMDCKEKYPYYMLDFDHVRGNKNNNLSYMVRFDTIDDIHKEVEKCDIVCANCHRKRTYDRVLNKYEPLV
jgi:hypothetical protein